MTATIVTSAANIGDFHHNIRKQLKVPPMRVYELIDILSDQPPDSEVELAIVAPVDGDGEDITVDRYFVDGVLPWQDGADDEGTEADDGELAIWLVGGEEDDVNAFLDAIEQPDA